MSHEPCSEIKAVEVLRFHIFIIYEIRDLGPVSQKFVREIVDVNVVLRLLSVSQNNCKLILREKLS